MSTPALHDRPLPNATHLTSDANHPHQRRGTVELRHHVEVPYRIPQRAKAAGEQPSAPGSAGSAAQRARMAPVPPAHQSRRVDRQSGEPRVLAPTDPPCGRTITPPVRIRAAADV